MNDLIFGILMLYVVINICMLFYIPLIILVERHETMVFTPNYLYRKTKMNIVGCYISSLIIIILTPLYHTFAIIYYMFHVGRKI